MCAGAAITILSGMIAQQSCDWRNWALVPLLIVVSMPFIQALGHGQNTCVSLLLLTITVALWRSGRVLAAGVACGLLFYKPQLGAVVAAALVMSTGRKSIAGLAITGTSLLAFNLIALPGTLSRFLRQLGPNVAFMQVEHKYMWDRHVTLKAFWRLLMQGFAAGDLTSITRILYLASALALAACVVAMIWKLRRQSDDGIARDRLIAATILAMPLTMPFYFDYDLLLLAVPAVLMAREHLVGERIDRTMLLGWFALFAWQFVNPAVAGATHVNGTVLILACVTAMTIRRAWRTRDSLSVEAAANALHSPPLCHAA
jgi:hypothetical protein